VPRQRMSIMLLPPGASAIAGEIMGCSGEVQLWAERREYQVGSFSRT
jgi:hypothetical protein